MPERGILAARESTTPLISTSWVSEVYTWWCGGYQTDRRASPRYFNGLLIFRYVCLSRFKNVYRKNLLRRFLADPIPCTMKCNLILNPIKRQNLFQIYHQQKILHLFFKAYCNFFLVYEVQKKLSKSKWDPEGWLGPGVSILELLLYLSATKMMICKLKWLFSYSAITYAPLWVFLETLSTSNGVGSFGTC